LPQLSPFLRKDTIAQFNFEIMASELSAGSLFNVDGVIALVTGGATG
jgi:hypothetical protein